MSAEVHELDVEQAAPNTRLELDAEAKEIFAQMKPILIERLGLDAEDEVLPTSRLVEDLRADSIDGIDLDFQLRKAGLDAAMPSGEAFLQLKTVGGLIQRVLAQRNSSH